MHNILSLQWLTPEWGPTNQSALMHVAMPIGVTTGRGQGVSHPTAQPHLAMSSNPVVMVH